MPLTEPITPDEFHKYLENYFHWASHQPRQLRSHLFSLEQWCAAEYDQLDTAYQDWLRTRKLEAKEIPPMIKPCSKPRLALEKALEALDIIGQCSNAYDEAHIRASMLVATLESQIKKDLNP